MEMLIPITFFCMIAAIVIVPRYLRTRERQAMQETLRTAYQNGQPVPPELIDALTSDSRGRDYPTPYRDLRRGIVWLAVGLAIAGIGYAISFEEREAFYPMMGAAVFPGVIGLALILLGLVGLAARPKA